MHAGDFIGAIMLFPRGHIHRDCTFACSVLEVYWKYNFLFALSACEQDVLDLIGA